jgi:hypothetical protein
MDKGLPYNRDCLLGSRKDPFKPRAAMGGAFSLRDAGDAPAHGSTVPSARGREFAEVISHAEEDVVHSVVALLPG